MKNYFIIFVALIVFFVSYHSWTAVNFDNIKHVKIAGQNIKVELALTKDQQERGLSGRESLKENEGMLFVFDKPNKYLFWMKGMNFPIDMIWLAPSESGDGGDMKVVYIKKDARPELYPETYGFTREARYVLEVASGFSEKNNLKEGDEAKFLY